MESDLVYVNSKLYPYQRDGVDFGIATGGRLLIGDEMGLGKTLQTIALLLHFRAALPALIICPASLLYNWRAELEMWVPSFRDNDTEPIQILRTTKQAIRPDARIDIISYALASRDQKYKELRKRKYGIVVCDESHKLKSRKSKRTKLLVPLLKSVRHVFLLSGTPVLNRPSELFTQLVALYKPKALWDAVHAYMKRTNVPNSTGMNQPHKLFSVFHQFGLRYCAAKMDRYGHWDYKGISNCDELNAVLKEVVMIRRLKRDVLTELPEKKRQRLIMAISDVAKRKIDRQVVQLQKAFRDEKSARGIRAKLQLVFKHKQLIMELYRTSAVAKIKPCVETVRDMLESMCGGNNDTPRKLLLFGHHRAMLDAIEEQCIEPFMRENSDKSYIRIDGSTPSLKRGELVEAFQTNAKCCVALLSITACGYGLTLTSASDVVFMEMYWNPGIMVQAEDRVHRIGQRNTCHMYYLVARDSFDDKMWVMLNNKMRIVSSLLDGKREQMFERSDRVDMTNTKKRKASVAPDALPQAKRPMSFLPMISPSSSSSVAEGPFSQFVFELTQ